jgi:cobalt-zinc-cadmium resistance protein CzcA
MLDKIIAFSIHNKLVVGLFTLGLIVWGTYSLTQLPIDAVPDITNNQAQIITVSPSLAAQEIERLVTFPVEQTMATIPSILEVRSISRFGLSIVTIVFKDKTDIYWARQQISERLAEAKSKIPPGVGNPELAPVTTGLGEIYQYTLHAKEGYEKKYDATELRSIQDWIVRRQLLGVQGVADVSSFGGFVKQYEIALEPSKLLSIDVSINEVFTALQKNNQNTGGAYIEKNPNAYFIRSEGLISSIKDIEAIVIKNTSQGIPVLLRDVAKVQYGHANRFGAMTYDDKGEVVGAIVMMLKGENSNKVIDNVKTRVAQIEKTLPEGVVIEPFLDRSRLVDRAIGTVQKNLLEGALIVIFVLVLFLGNFRAGMIVASVIPLAMLFAISMMHLFGVSGNLMSLGAIDFGLIVDGAVIIVEATLHHLMKRKGDRLSQNEMDIEVYDSAKKIRSSAAFGEIIILIVYLPILALSGIEGKMFGPMAQTVSFAILGAFILSLTYVPMVSALFLSKQISTKRTISDRMMDFFQRIYTPLINAALKKKALVLSITLALFILTLTLFSSMGGEFMPTLEEGDFAVETRVLTGSSMERTIEASTKAGAILKAQFPEVKSVVAKIGSSEIPTDPMPIEACDLMIILKDKDEWTSAETREELAEKMAEALEAIPGVTFGFQQPIQMRFNELMSGARQDVAIKIFGEDLEQLTQIAKKVSKQVQSTEGAQDLYVEEVSGLPQIVIRYHREKMAQFGLNIEDINTVVQTAFAGQAAGIVYEGEKRFDLVLRLDKGNRKSVEDVQNLFITAPNGTHLPLNQVADVKVELGPNQIQREDAKRRLTIGFNVRGRDVQSIVKEVEQKIKSNVKMPAGYYVTYGGQFENLVEAKQRLSVAVPIALLLILLLLYFTFHSFKQSILIFTAIPLSAIGGVFALLLRDMPFSISAGVGFIALFGVAVLNGIVLIGEFNRLKKSGMTDVHEIVLKGTRIRLRPVLMTAMVASLGFIPMAISSGAGGEVQKPLATVVIGGLISATLLTLIVLPLLYIYFEKGMKTNKISVGAAVIALLFFALSSVQAQDVSVYSLEQCMQEAMKNNPSLKAKMQEVEWQQKLKQTSTDIGKTDVTLLYGQYNSNITSDNNFTVSQTLPFPTLFSSNIAYHNAQIKGSEWSAAITKNELLFNVKSVYAHLQFLHAYQVLLLQQDSAFTEFARVAALRFSNGESTLLEKMSAESRLQEVRNALFQNKSDIEIYFTHLRTLMNSNVVFSIPQNVFQKVDLTLSGDSAYANNPRVKYFEQQIEIAEAAKKVEMNKMLPDITLGYFNQTLIGNPIDNGFATSINRFQGVQVGLSIPLWFVPHTAKTSAAKINEEIATSNLQAQQNAIEGEYQQMLREYLKWKNTLSYYEVSQLPQSRLIAQQSQKAFKAGEIGYFEHSQNLMQVLQIQSAYLNTLHQYNQSVYKIQFITAAN